MIKVISSVSVALVCGCAALGITQQKADDAAIDCGSAEIQHAILDQVCNHVDPPAEIAVRVATCLARHLFTAPQCGPRPDGGA